jgi:hypothetical protein
VSLPTSGENWRSPAKRCGRQKGTLAKQTSEGEEIDIDEVDPSLDPPLTEDIVFTTLEAALTSRTAKVTDPGWTGRRGLEGSVDSSDAAKPIYGDLGSPTATARRRRVGRVADRLRRLSDQGRVIRLRYK